MKQILLAGVVTFGLTACATTPQPMEVDNFTKLKGSEILSLLPGNSLKGTDKSGEYVIYYSSGSTMKIIRNGKKDVGKWRVSGNQYCRQWTKLGKGKNRCLTFYKRGDAITWVRKGKVRDRTFLLRGNPAGL